MGSKDHLLFSLLIYLNLSIVLYLLSKSFDRWSHMKNRVASPTQKPIDCLILTWLNGFTCRVTQNIIGAHKMQKKGDSKFFILPILW